MQHAIDLVQVGQLGEVHQGRRRGADLGIAARDVPARHDVQPCREQGGIRPHAKKLPVVVRQSRGKGQCLAGFRPELLGRLRPEKGVATPQQSGTLPVDVHGLSLEFQELVLPQGQAVRHRNGKFVAEVDLQLVHAELIRLGSRSDPACRGFSAVAFGVARIGEQQAVVVGISARIREADRAAKAHVVDDNEGSPCFPSIFITEPQQLEFQLDGPALVGSQIIEPDLHGIGNGVAIGELVPPQQVPALLVDDVDIQHSRWIDAAVRQVDDERLGAAGHHQPVVGQRGAFVESIGELSGTPEGQQDALQLGRVEVTPRNRREKALGRFFQASTFNETPNDLGEWIKRSLKFVQWRDLLNKQTDHVGQIASQEVLRLHDLEDGAKLGPLSVRTIDKLLRPSPELVLFEGTVESLQTLLVDALQNQTVSVPADVLRRATVVIRPARHAIGRQEAAEERARARLEIAVEDVRHRLAGCTHLGVVDFHVDPGSTAALRPRVRAAAQLRLEPAQTHPFPRVSGVAAGTTAHHVVHRRSIEPAAASDLVQALQVPGQLVAAIAARPRPQQLTLQVVREAFVGSVCPASNDPVPGREGILAAELLAEVVAAGARSGLLIQRAEVPCQHAAVRLTPGAQERVDVILGKAFKFGQFDLEVETVVLSCACRSRGPRQRTSVLRERPAPEGETLGAGRMSGDLLVVIVGIVNPAPGLDVGIAEVVVRKRGAETEEVGGQLGASNGVQQSLKCRDRRGEAGGCQLESPLDEGVDQLARFNCEQDYETSIWETQLAKGFLNLRAG